MDQNSLFNKDTRILAIDDSPFSRDDKSTSIVGVIMRKDLYLETLVRKVIAVDGMDSTEKVLEAIKERGSGVGVMMTQGVTLGGFNILDLARIYEETKIPIINVVDHEPDMKAIEDALRKHFKDWKSRYSALSGNFFKSGSIYVQAIGIENKSACRFLEQVTINGKIPEPLRIANLIAGIL